MFGKGERFDLKRAVFSAQGSCISIHEEYPTGELYLTFSRISPWFLLERRALVKLVPTKDGRPIVYSYHATPSELTISTAIGKLEICIAENELLRIRGSGGVRLSRTYGGDNDVSRR